MRSLAKCEGRLDKKSVSSKFDLVAEKKKNLNKPQTLRSDMLMCLCKAAAM